MSYEVFVMRFEGGDSAALDTGAARTVLAPYAEYAKDEGEYHYCGLRTRDGGEADVHVRPDCVTFHRFSTGDVLDVLAKLVRRLNAVLVCPDAPAVLRSEEVRPQLPAGLRDDAVVIPVLTGAAIDALLKRA
ncbi:hypothetical protein ACFYVL_39245 [Streptomyces sp. NPDC004111]|uniref:hypothetical protein n=1 Tax=Streptomyces sp. NPDC004111 TaxID=3364690 RepID=UPI0036B927E4